MTTTTTTVIEGKSIPSSWFPDESQQSQYQVKLLKIFAIIITGLGLIWYNLTTVTRAPFPTDHLKTWSTHNKPPTLQFPINFQLHLPTTTSSDWGQPIITKLSDQKSVSSEVLELQPQFSLGDNWSTPVSNWTMEEMANLELPNFSTTTEKGSEPLTYHVVLVPSAERGLYFSEKLPLTLYVLYPTSTSLEQVQELLVYGIKEILQFLSDQEKDVLEVDYSLRYQLLFTALHGAPPTEDGPLGSPLAHTIEDLFMPTVKSLQPLSHFEVASQVQYYAPLTIQPKKMVGYGSSPSWYAVEPDMQTLFLNSAWDLASVSSAPDLHFLLYVPPPELTPLHLVDHAGRQVPSNSFIVPQWGGVVILNPDATGKVSPSQVHDAITIHLQHFHSLLGLVTPHFPPHSTTPVLLSPHGVSPLAFDRYQFRRVARFAQDTTATLNGLQHLISTIPAMEVRHDSMRSVKQSISDLLAAHHHLTKGHLAAGLRLFNRAYLATEASFFHPRMVAKMYFPPDAAYAIFLPLLLPAALPLVIASVKYLKYLRRVRSS